MHLPCIQYVGRTAAAHAEADDGNRTRLTSLGSWGSTNELHLHHRHYMTQQ